MKGPTVEAPHGITPHGVFGWCAACPGRTMADELAEWRAWACAQLAPYAGPDESGAPVSPPPVRGIIPALEGEGRPLTDVHTLG